MQPQPQTQSIVRERRPVIIIGLSELKAQCKHPLSKRIVYTTGHFWMGANGEVCDDVLEHCLCLACMTEIYRTYDSRDDDGEQDLEALG